MNTKDRMIEGRRITDVLYAHWNEVRGTRAFPRYEEINQQALRNVWDDTFILEVLKLIQGHGFRFIHQGSHFSDEYIKDSTGLYIKNVILSFFETASDYYQKVLDTHAPLRREDVYKSTDGHVLKYREILLPLGDANSGEITHLLGGMRFIRGEE
jgi:hypothetical protein